MGKKEDEGRGGRREGLGRPEIEAGMGAGSDGGKAPITRGQRWRQAHQAIPSGQVKMVRWISQVSALGGEALCHSCFRFARPSSGKTGSATGHRHVKGVEGARLPKDFQDGLCGITRGIGSSMDG